MLICLSIFEVQHFNNTIKNITLTERIASNEIVQFALSDKFLETGQFILVAGIDCYLDLNLTFLIDFQFGIVWRN